MEEKEYKFWGWENTDKIRPKEEFEKLGNPKDFYDLLCKIWCQYTCAPRMRDEWTIENQTMGQCSITAFLVQDIYGGQVYGVLRPGGNYHCYNEVDGIFFDLTSEQFGDEKLDYNNNPVQSRQEHFSKKEKYERYLYLKKEVEKALAS